MVLPAPKKRAFRNIFHPTRGRIYKPHKSKDKRQIARARPRPGQSRLPPQQPVRRWHPGSNPSIY